MTWIDRGFVRKGEEFASDGGQKDFDGSAHKVGSPNRTGKECIPNKCESVSVKANASRCMAWRMKDSHAALPDDHIISLSEQAIRWWWCGDLKSKGQSLLGCLPHHGHIFLVNQDGSSGLRRKEGIPAHVVEVAVRIDDRRELESLLVEDIVDTLTLEPWIDEECLWAPLVNDQISVRLERTNREAPNLHLWLLQRYLPPSRSRGHHVVGVVVPNYSPCEPGPSVR